MRATLALTSFALAVLAHRKGTVRSFLFTHHEHEGHLGQLRIADLAPYLFIPCVHGASDVQGGQLPLQIGADLHVLIAHREQDGLFRSQPEREAATGMLDQYSDEALQAAEGRKSANRL